MKTELIFATNNIHKIDEIKPLLPIGINIISLDQLLFFEDIPETGNTLKENALQKARFIYNKFERNCFADDTGLEIDALSGRPGVYSARYAGEHCSFVDNVNKVLEEMKYENNRKARFRTVIALIYNDIEYFFEGVVEGEILLDYAGVVGFGYDPIFKPVNQLYSFAEMPLVEKNKISHRSIAAQKLVDFLK
ncbi:MAG: RdgB/HAM1 family non-canonical purine NTP pyrophosphatase [Bacteroidota bacterium]